MVDIQLTGRATYVYLQNVKSRRENKEVRRVSRVSRVRRVSRVSRERS